MINVTLEQKTHKPLCILHIGMPKTGSTVLQEALFKSRAKDNFDYIYFNGIHNANHLLSIFSKNPSTYYWHIYNNTKAEEISEFNKSHFEELKEKLRRINTNKVIISSESIVFMDVAEIYGFRDFLMIHFDSIHVVAYVRPPISYTQSCFQQFIKLGDLRYPVAEMAPRYRDMFSKFDAIFGRDQVTLIKYDRASLLEGDVVADFCVRANISITSEERLHANKSISLEALAILYVFYKFSGTQIALDKKEALVNYFLNFGTKKIILSSRLTKLILKYISADLTWIESRLGTTFAEPYSEHGVEISSEKDLINIALESTQIMQDTFLPLQEQIKLDTPEKIAYWVCNQLALLK